MSSKKPKIRVPASRLRQMGDWRCRALVDSPVWSLLEQDRWPPDPDDPAHITTLKRNSRNHSGLLQLADGSSFYFKRFPHQGLRAHLPGTVRNRRGRTNWRLSRHLQRHGVRVAQAEALLESRREGWFLAEGLLAQQSLAKLARRSELCSAEVCDPLAEMIADLHAAGVTHGDLKWGNILLDEHRQLRLVDLDSARLHTALDRPRADQDLARCLVSALELGMSRDWAEDFIARYARYLDESEIDLIQRLRPRVTRISRVHCRRYKREPVSL